MSSAVNPLTSQTPVTSGTTKSPANDPLANESTFLKLLVSQLQNQDPLQPTDSNQFVSQLTSYSQLEQLIGIHQNTTTLAGTSATSSNSSGTPSGTTPTTNTGN